MFRPLINFYFILCVVKPSSLQLVECKTLFSKKI
nr:MAG TPA: hypothetical protein [Ackermannviridae sp.]DAK97962.1 MAG TPA: hypothetical protein [Ackermannviridae sp.]